MDWKLIESHDREFLYAAKVSGGILVKYDRPIGAVMNTHISYVPDYTLRTSRSGKTTIVKK